MNPVTSDGLGCADPPAGLCNPHVVVGAGPLPISGQKAVTGVNPVTSDGLGCADPPAGLCALFAQRNDCLRNQCPALGRFG